MINMSLRDAAALLNLPAPDQNIVFQGISTDTRTLKPGNLFVAIVGENFDGNHYVAEALKKGAVAALVSQASDLNLPQLVVTDTILALGRIAAHWRDQFTLQLVGVTGSNGKTTLKNMLAAILRAARQGNVAQVLATEGNLNNNIGVPLTLARLSTDHRYGVIEMGMNHFGEIEYLTRMTKPVVAIINNAAAAHLEGLQDVAGVARAKGEIFLGLPAEGIAILNRDDAHYDYWRGITTQHPHVSFSLQHAADVTATIPSTQPNLTKQTITLHTPQGNVDVTLPLLGLHNVKNAMAATAAAIALGIDLTAIKKGLETVAAAPGRLNHHVLPNGMRVIDDTYNANPFSTQAAIKTLAEFSGTRILVLGDMRELGPNAKELHFTTGQIARDAGIDYLFTLGELTAATAAAFGEDAHHFTDRDMLIAALAPMLTSDTTILIKGSRSMHMENVVAGIIPDVQLAHSH